jgi:starch synthase
MKIAVVTTGRFHVCDLARELSLLGHDVRFYSLVPPWRTRKFELPSECNRWILPRIPFAALMLKFASRPKHREIWSQKLVQVFDRKVARCLEPCDVLIGMSGMCNELAAVAKEKFGCRIWIERGSRHILSQQEILKSIPGAEQVSEFAVARELFDYDLADRVVVLSKHCEESFLERGLPQHKLFRNPLGVNLGVFQPTMAPKGVPTIIMTGTWSLRKGCDILTKAWRNLPGTRLLHVGSVSDCPIPRESGFIHYDRVEQSELVGFYAQSHVFALASHEEGLATVQPQALACGLRLVCTNRTGGEDLIKYTNEPDVISVVPPNDVESLTLALKIALERATQETGERDRLSIDSRKELSWHGYARRYEIELKRSLTRAETSGIE